MNLLGHIRRQKELMGGQMWPECLYCSLIPPQSSQPHAGSHAQALHPLQVSISSPTRPSQQLPPPELSLLSSPISFTAWPAISILAVLGNSLEAPGELFGNVDFWTHVQIYGTEIDEGLARKSAILISLLNDSERGSLEVLYIKHHSIFILSPSCILNHLWDLKERN